MIQKILCPTDGTDHSDIAVVYAAQLAAKFGVPLTVCVVNIAHGGARGPVINHWTDQEMSEKLDRARALVRDNGVPDAKMVDIVSREAAAGIVSYAEHNGFDHIVVGTGDKRGLSRLMIGSVAADVMARAHCTVTVAR
ncbi:Nucleotide-binding universal stress protein, UspA family [Paracoccus aminovorans]|uniref:Nucleotide-binding universal stress protein, UspA family n=1 Tax=Paracoccus aminovorans TaxID=34004 RepID=A0A1I2XS60_9RHOB|nr:universal stress protein [Paracoccus aminovorans]CQR87288.1 UspA domain-containing protein [Paracoccus aminovorans]SFH15919.1 Nucleotide-binding universal stress protein, UspA family [Paracoccus aminovorans]